MKKKIIGILIIMTLVATFFSTAAISNEAYKSNNEKLTESIKQIPTMKIREMNPLFQPTIVEKANNPAPSINGADVQVTTSGGNECHPNIKNDMNGNPIVVYDYETSGYKQIYMQRSLDGGNSWPVGQKYYLDGNEDLSTINPILYTAKNMAGVFYQVEQTDPNMYSVHLENLDDPDSWIKNKGDYSNVTSWIGEVDFAGFGTTLFYGFIGDMIFEDYNEKATVHVYWTPDFRDTEAYEGMFFFNSEETPFSHPTAAAGNKLYFAAQQEHSSGSRILITYTPSNYPTYENADFKFITYGRSNLSNPRIAASGEHAYLAVQNDINGNEDILCYTPGGFTWKRHIIADSSDDEMYPSISANGEIAVCTFIKNGNLFMSKTVDGGETWTDPEQINDESGTLAGDFRCIDTFGPHIVWTDNRNGNKDIYYDSINTPWIEITDMASKFGRFSAEISNTGTSDANNIPWNMDVDGLVFLGSHSEGTITSLAAGSSTTIDTNFIFGLGDGIITIMAGGESIIIRVTILGPFILWDI